MMLSLQAIVREREAKQCSIDVWVFRAEGPGRLSQAGFKTRGVGGWQVHNDHQHLWPLFFRDIYGTWELMPSGNLWFFSGDHTDPSTWIYNTFLLTPPTHEFDSAHVNGAGAICKPKNPAWIDKRLIWFRW